MPLDPRIAQGLIEAVDTRFEQLARRQPHTAYGVVAAVDLVSRKASVYISGDPTASAGFSFGPVVPSVGELVRVMIDPRGDRYIESGTGQDLATRRLRLSETADVTLDSTDHAFQIGPDNGGNLAMDVNEIMARDNGGTDTLNLNVEGGLVQIGSQYSGNDTNGAAIKLGSDAYLYKAGSALLKTDGDLQAVGALIAGNGVVASISNPGGAEPGTTYPAGLSTFSWSNDGSWPTSYGECLTVKLSSARMFQIVVAHRSVDAWMRVYYDTDGAWDAWVRLIGTSQELLEFVPVNTTLLTGSTSASIAATSLATGLPSTARLAFVSMRARTSSVNANNEIYLRHGSDIDKPAGSCFMPVANFDNETVAAVEVSGGNIGYGIVRSAGTITYGYYLRGYWRAS